MDMIVEVALIIFFALISAGITGYITLKRGHDKGVAEEKIRQDEVLESSKNTSARILAEADATAKQQLLQAKEEEVERRRELDSEHRRRRKDLDRTEERLQSRLDGVETQQKQLDNRERKLNQRDSKLDQRDNQLDQRDGKLEQRHSQQDQRDDELDQRSSELDERDGALDQRAEKLENAENEWLVELQRVAQMSVDEAQNILLDRVEKETRHDMARLVREVEAEVSEEADRKAREIVTMAVERVASEHVSETAVSSVALPSDEMKGRIIGRQGRNIRAIEQALGVDLVVDDTPEAIIISSFDPIRREVARMALSKLVTDGRIHPARIEKEVERAQKEIEQVIQEAAEQAIMETGSHGLHREVRKLLGRLRFRTSYGQNQLYHAVETAHIAGIIAEELHADVKIAKLGGLLHDLGKAVSHDVDGPHAIVGAKIAQRYGVPDTVVNCIASHHGEVEPLSIEAIIVAAADAISGARPGARRESLETYIKRVTELEDIGNSFEGVTSTYAIQAGREIRVLVQPDTVDDLEVIALSKGIAKKIEDNLQYPGQIRVTVIRETRSVEYAQ